MTTGRSIFSSFFWTMGKHTTGHKSEKDLEPSQCRKSPKVPPTSISKKSSDCIICLEEKSQKQQNLADFWGHLSQRLSSEPVSRKPVFANRNQINDHFLSSDDELPPLWSKLFGIWDNRNLWHKFRIWWNVARCFWTAKITHVTCIWTWLQKTQQLSKLRSFLAIGHWEHFGKPQNWPVAGFSK